DAVGSVIAIDDAITVTVGGDAAGDGAGWGRRSGDDLLFLCAGGERQNAQAGQHDGLVTHGFSLQGAQTPAHRSFDPLKAACACRLRPAIPASTDGASRGMIGTKNPGETGPDGRP